MVNSYEQTLDQELNMLSELHAFTSCNDPKPADCITLHYM